MDDENVQLSLQYLCPDVDICTWSQRDSNLTIEHMEERPIGGCCKGCSCNKNCTLLMNCCFSGDMEEMSNSKNSSTFDNGNMPIGKGNSSIEMNRKKLQSNEENAPNIEEIRVANGEDIRTHGHRLSTMSMSSIGSEIIQAHINDTSDTRSEITTLGEVNKTVSREHMTVDNGSASIDKEFGVKQCLYTRTGTPNTIWIEGEQSYRMVTSSPPEGCKKVTICTALTQKNKQATCDSGTVYPWGDLFPVYSIEHKLVFKNELCACCNGILDYKLWSPFLKCDQFDPNGRKISISESLRFLQESKSFPDHCNVHFDYNDSRVLMDNKCNVNTIDTCQLASDVLFRVPDRVNLTRSEIISLCNIGPDATFNPEASGRVKRVYKNVFCAICNNVLTNAPTPCSWREPYNPDYKFTQLLDVASLQRYAHVRKKNEVASRNNACLKKNDNWIEGSCRQIGCPSGRLRDVNGVCTFPSESWVKEYFEVTVNLKYTTSNTTVLRMLNTEEVTKDDVVNVFRKTNPWPSGWVITRILHTADDYTFGPRMAVYLLTTISRPETIMAHIKTAMGLNWTILLNGIDFTFEQSFLKYDIGAPFVHIPTNTYMFGPSCLYYLIEFESSHIKIPPTEVTYWEALMDDLTRPVLTFPLTKLLICEHISLLGNEYTLLAFETVLVNLLTNQVMFDKEFEVVKDEYGKFVAHICLADSSFVWRSEKNGASARPIIIHHLVWVKHLITVAIAACAPVLLRNH